MLLQLKTGQVVGYSEGKGPLIYLVSSVQAVAASQQPFVFSDGHGSAFNTSWYNTLENLEKVDWGMVYQRYRNANYNNDMDRQRRKQAEFLVYQRCDWSLIDQIGVINADVRLEVEGIMSEFNAALRKPVNVQPSWYY